jgi:hypothetical protein
MIKKEDHVDPTVERVTVVLTKGKEKIKAEVRAQRRGDKPFIGLNADVEVEKTTVPFSVTKARDLFAAINRGWTLRSSSLQKGTKQRVSA